MHCIGRAGLSRLRCIIPTSGTLHAPTVSVPCCALRHLSSGEEVDPATAWRHAMERKYGQGNFQLFRALYKDLCDEMRRENFTKPPPPPAAPQTGKPPSIAHTFSPQTSPCASSGSDSAEEGVWTVRHQRENNMVVFTRSAIAATRQGRVVAFSRIETRDPPKLNALLTFADWFPIDVLVERNGVILHFAMAANEGGMHMRNARAYDCHTSPSLMSTTDDAEWARRFLYYDGPCLWHLEYDMQNELYDIMQDHGITLQWMRWAAEWVFYLEHVCFTRWSLGLLEELIPRELQGPEEDFLLESEVQALDEPSEDWLEIRTR